MKPSTYRGWGPKVDQGWRDRPKVDPGKTHRLDPGIWVDLVDLHIGHPEYSREKSLEKVQDYRAENRICFLLTVLPKAHTTSVQSSLKNISHHTKPIEEKGKAMELFKKYNW